MLIEDEGVIRPHFHRIDQFQILVGGRALFGKHEAEPVTVHYTDGYTPYGPLRPLGGSFTFFTLRALHNPGFFAMPGSKQEKELPTGRGLTVPAELRPGAASPTRIEERDVIAPHSDGLSARTLRLPPGASFRPRGSAEGGGQYQLVVNGSLDDAGYELPALSLIFLSADEETSPLRAGRHGADVLLLQFPVDSTAAERVRAGG